MEKLQHLPNSKNPLKMTDPLTADLNLKNILNNFIEWFECMYMTIRMELCKLRDVTLIKPQVVTLYC